MTLKAKLESESERFSLALSGSLWLSLSLPLALAFLWHNNFKNKNCLVDLCNNYNRATFVFKCKIGFMDIWVDWSKEHLAVIKSVTKYS